LILIISEYNDITTNHVIDWLMYYGKEYYRLNVEDLVEIDFLTNQEFSIKINNIETLLYSDITSVWFRRGRIILKVKKTEEIDLFNKYFNYFIKNEINVIEDYINYLLTLKKHIGNPTCLDVNKLQVLNIAKSVGLDVPDYFITNSKENLLSNIFKDNKYITKVLSNVFQFIHNDKSYMTYTEVLEEKLIKNLPKEFFPSLCQVLIEKEFDIRIFFLNNNFYSMAIFSQKREESKIDFRKYSYEKPDREVTITLPKGIENKIIKLMSELKLNSGSIDMILDKNGQYFFLEVNPIGQFGMVDFPCNYGICNEIAKFLN
jgi:ATP-GRASP peptide maturase of grasp-with-spasm system